MAGYVKIWTSLRQDEKFLILTGNQRSVYLQLLLVCKDQSDDGHVRFKNYSHAAQAFGGDDSTTTRALLKLHSLKLISMEKDTHNVIHIELPNYLYWQGVTVKEVSRGNRKEEKKKSQKTLTRAEQSRAEQSIHLAAKPPVISTTNPDHKKAIKYFCDLYLEKYQVKYLFAAGKDGTIIKRLLATFGFDFFCRLVDQLYITNDEFIVNKGKVSIGVLSACANKLTQEIMGRDDLRLKFSEKERQALTNIAKGLGLQ